MTTDPPALVGVQNLEPLRHGRLDLSGQKIMSLREAKGLVYKFRNDAKVTIDVMQKSRIKNGMEPNRPLGVTDFLRSRAARDRSKKKSVVVCGHLT